MHPAIEGGVYEMPQQTQDRFLTYINDLPDRYTDKLAFMRLIEKLFQKLPDWPARLGGPFSRNAHDEVLHLTDQFIMGSLKAMVWTAANNTFADTSSGSLKIAGFFAAFVGIVPQGVSLISLRIAGSKWELGRWLQRTMPGVAASMLIPLAFYHDLGFQEKDPLSGSLWEAVRIAGAIAALEKATGLVTYDAMQFIRSSYISLKEQACKWSPRIRQLVYGDEGQALLGGPGMMRQATLALTGGRPAPLSQEAADIKATIDRYNSLPLLFLFFLIAFFVAMGTNTNTDHVVQKTFNNNSYGIAFLSSLADTILVIILLKIHSLLFTAGDY